MTNIIVTLQHEATHHWPTCNLPEVIYLKNKHRHTFYITAKKQVSHDDRDIEIILFKHKIAQFLDETFKSDFGGMSCEMICHRLMTKFDLSYVSVLEDNENGAEVWCEPK